MYKHLKFKRPIMLAGWPGMGNVGLGAVSYIRKGLGVELFAELDAGQVSLPDNIIVENGITKLPVLPNSQFYYAEYPGLIIFEGVAQISGHDGMEVMGNILDLAEKFNVKRIFTGAAFAMPISYRDPSKVFVVANQKRLLDELIKYPVKILKEGQISGMNGLLLGLANERGIEAACLLATLPHYAIGVPNPKSSRAIVGMFSNIFNISIDMTVLNESVNEMNSRLSIIEERIRDVFSSQEENEEEDIPETPSKRVPDKIIEKIERLFEEVKADRSKAPVLKKELDRWNLYELYEDRFLDIFRKK